MSSVLDVNKIKDDFPLLGREVNGKPIHYLDSAASSQKPVQVLEAMDTYYRTTHANVHRGAYKLASDATDAMESARAKVAGFIGASSENEIVFTKNATEAMNLFAQSWGRANLSAGDVVVISEMEHHANIVPWHMLAASNGIELRWIPVTEDGYLDLTNIDELLNGAKLLAVTATSNVLGTINPIAELSAAAKRAGALTVVDASQFVPHVKTDVAQLGVDALVFTGHKMLGPTGVGVFWAKAELLEEMPPFLGGGEMILHVTKDGFTTNEIPHKFEAGTPPIAEIIGLGAAVDYLNTLGMDNVRAHEVELTRYTLKTLGDRYGDDLTIHGPADAEHRGGVFSFTYKDVHAHDMSQVLDEQNVYVRAGHHCAKPLMKVLGVQASARASVYLYNDESDVDALADALAHADSIFGF